MSLLVTTSPKTATNTNDNHKNAKDLDMTTALAPNDIDTNTSTTETIDKSGGKVRLHNVIHGEWIKFWSVRSTSITLKPSCAATLATTSPPGPAPITTRSCFLPMEVS